MRGLFAVLVASTLLTSAGAALGEGGTYSTGRASSSVPASNPSASDLSGPTSLCAPCDTVPLPLDSTAPWPLKY
jgi:hypothetical protein